MSEVGQAGLDRCDDVLAEDGEKPGIEACEAFFSRHAREAGH